MWELPPDMASHDSFHCTHGFLHTCSSRLIEKTQSYPFPSPNLVLKAILAFILSSSRLYFDRPVTMVPCVAFSIRRELRLTCTYWWRHIANLCQFLDFLPWKFVDFWVKNEIRKHIMIGEIYCELVSWRDFHWSCVECPLSEEKMEEHPREIETTFTIRTFENYHSLKWQVQQPDENLYIQKNI